MKGAASQGRPSILKGGGMKFYFQYAGTKGLFVIG
jgi:hypothetical protein